MTAHDEARREVAQASRILYGLGLVDAFGHVSRRSPAEPGAFLLSRNLAPGLVTPEDVLEHLEDGSVPSRPEERLFLERFIHAGLYRARADVGAVVHSHAPQAVAFSVVGEARLKPLSHLCGFLADMGAPFEIADVVGDGSDLLIRDAKLAAALADHLGQSGVTLMRGHGFTAVGATVAEAVFRAVYTVVNCDIQAAALRLGTPRFLSSSEASACQSSTAGQADRAWRLWLHEYAADI